MKIDRKLHRTAHYEDQKPKIKAEDPLARFRHSVEMTIGVWPQEIWDYTFKDNNLLLAALTHTSFYNEVHPPWGHYQRLEFLGDAILEYIVSEYLFHKYPDVPEGVLTKKRAAMVQESAFATLADKWHLSALILHKGTGIGSKEACIPSIKADVVEAVCAAIYLDGGIEELKKRILPRLIELEGEKSEAATDYKTILQEKIQPLGLGTPVYHTIGQEGPDHAPTFTVEVIVSDRWRASGSGHSLKAAGHAAAKSLLEQLAREEIEAEKRACGKEK